MDTTHEGVLIARKEDVLPNVLSRSYEEVALQFINDVANEEVALREHGVVTARGLFKEISHLFNKEAEGGPKMLEVVKEGIIRFAHSLDKFNTLSQQLELIALYKAREIDREFLLMLIEVVGIEKARELATTLTARHKHTLKK